jgi:hypothetical protein
MTVFTTPHATATDTEVFAAFATGRVLRGDTARVEPVNEHAGGIDTLTTLVLHGTPVALRVVGGYVFDSRQYCCRVAAQMHQAREACGEGVVEMPHVAFRSLLAVLSVDLRGAR